MTTEGIAASAAHAASDDDVDASRGPQHALGRSRHGAATAPDALDVTDVGDETSPVATALVAEGRAEASAVDAIVDAAAPEYVPRTRSKGIARRARSIAGRVLLDVLAFGGLVCILLVAASFLFKVSIVMFATGSMTPTIPAGSIAFVREIPATEIAVGDVVTVDRSDMQQLPVTHRVIEIVDTSGDVVTFRMQGDANADPDIAPYEETTVRLVLWSIPGLADVIVWFQNPFVLGGITLGATVLVTWAFWPRDGRAEAVAAARHAD